MAGAGLGSRPASLRLAVTVAAGLDALLVLYGVARHPTSLAGGIGGPLGLTADVGILALYAAAAWRGAPASARRWRPALDCGVIGGAVGAAVFAAAVLVGYLAPLDSAGNALLGTAEFGGLFLVLLVTALAAGHAAGRVRAGIVASLWAAALASLAWLAVVLATYYVFWGSPQEARQFVADQVITDLQRSGMTDLRAFVMQDYMGAAFFHLLLGPLAALVLGTLGGGIGAVLARLHGRRAADT